MEIKTQIDQSGRVLIPAKLRDTLGIELGDEILLRLENDEIHLIPLRQAVKMAQGIVRRYVTAETSLVDELIQARCKETAGE